MINNPLPSSRGRARVALAAAVLLLGAVGACNRGPQHPGAFQGVVEFDERVLGFETGGRVTKVSVERGTVISSGDVLATLDDTLERTSRETREAEADAAKARAALVRAGSRPEEIKSMAAQVRVAEANEALLKKTYARDQTLLAAGAVTQASLDDVESRLLGATAQRESLEQRLRELRNGSRKPELDSSGCSAASSHRPEGAARSSASTFCASPSASSSASAT